MAVVCEVGQRPEAQPDQLLVERVDFAHGRDVDKFVPKQHHISLEGALAGDQLTQKAGNAGVVDFKAVKPVAHGVQHIVAEVVRCGGVQGVDDAGFEAGIEAGIGLAAIDHGVAEGIQGRDRLVEGGAEFAQKLIFGIGIDPIGNGDHHRCAQKVLGNGGIVAQFGGKFGRGDWLDQVVPIASAHFFVGEGGDDFSLFFVKMSVGPSDGQQAPYPQIGPGTVKGCNGNAHATPQGNDRNARLKSPYPILTFRLTVDF